MFPIARGLLLALSCVLAALNAGCTSDDPPQLPNLVLVVLDTTRADALSTYGNAPGVTPHLDEIAAEGALFERAFSTDFWTLPSHASLFTGLYPSEHGATTETNRLGEDVSTLAEVLEQAGYATGAFVANPWVGTERGFAQGFQHFSETWRPGRKPGASHQLDPGAVEDARGWITDQVGSERPFFAFLNLNGAHLPYDPDPVVHSEIHPHPRPLERVAGLKQLAGMWAHLAGVFQLEELDYQILRELYDAEVAMTDALVGRLADELTGLGVLDQTVVVVTSDHGENIGDHGLIDHTLSMYDSTLHVPLLIRYPPAVPPGTRRSDLASGVDVFPTVLSLLGLADERQGLDSLFHPDRTAAAFVAAENERPTNGVELMRRTYPGFDADSIDERMRMVRTERHKLIWREKRGVELYDLASDPGEERDIAESHPEARDRMLQILSDWESGLARPPAVAPLESQDEEAREQLRALGYAE